MPYYFAESFAFVAFELAEKSYVATFAWDVPSVQAQETPLAGVGCAYQAFVCLPITLNPIKLIPQKRGSITISIPRMSYLPIKRSSISSVLSRGL